MNPLFADALVVAGVLLGIHGLVELCASIWVGRQEEES